MCTILYIIHRQNCLLYRGMIQMQTLEFAGVTVALPIAKQAMSKQEVSRSPIEKDTSTTFTNLRPTY